MRHAALVLVFAAFAFTANSQLTILPQAGLENSATKISYNSLPYFSPVSQIQPQVSLRADYRFKNGWGPFAGISTNHSLINYNFSDPENGMTTYRASLGKMQLQLQAGLQYTTKPIFLNRHSPTKSSKTISSEKTTSCYSHYLTSCSHYSSNCCQRKSGTEQKTKSAAQRWSVRIQPSAGFGFMPSDKPDLVTKISGSQTSYTYPAGNIRTAMLTGVGFEFARNKTRFFTLSINYFKAIGNDKTTFTTESASKTTTTSLNSKLSGWNASIGIPVSFAKKPVYKTRKAQEFREQYRIRCSSRKVI
jgi:hypothetical protein